VNSKRNAGILKKVEELKALLVFSRRIIPFMEDVIVFVKDIIPVVEELKSSVEMSSDKLPKASKQLDKVTMATELASTEILNLVEGIFRRIEIIRKDILAREAQLATLREKASQLDDSRGGESRGATVSIVADRWGEFRQALEECAEPTSVREALDGIQSDCTSIMIALQVQDITAQQIAAVNKLMESVDAGLNKMLRNFREEQQAAQTPGFDHPRLDIPFDTSAEYTGAEKRQEMADQLIRRGVAADPGKPRKKGRNSEERA
jgi:chemotaxis regulatin CheY-phosphate phosphatase CheZ